MASFRRLTAGQAVPSAALAAALVPLVGLRAAQGRAVGVAVCLVCCGVTSASVALAAPSVAGAVPSFTIRRGACCMLAARKKD